MDDNPGVSLFQGTSINVENALQNQEEAEDLEDQKRRQEEIQCLLTKAMDEFNYDESSVNSSTNVSVDETDQLGYMQRYKEASMDDQLKILYEVRVREVKGLTDQLDNMKAEYLTYQKDTKRGILLLEADKDKLKLSLQQAQAILVDKTEEIMKLHVDLENFNSLARKLEEDVMKLSEDNSTIQHTNEKLMEQLSFMQKGLTTNSMTDRQLQELHHAELFRLNHSLDAALTKLDRKERECKENEQKLKEQSREKDDLIVEKSSVINKLTAHIDSAQSQCQELLQVIEKLSIENQSLKKAAADKTAEQMMKMTGLVEKSEFIKGLQKELEKSQEAFRKLTLEYESIKKSFSELAETCSAKETQTHNYEKQIKLMLKDNSNLQNNTEKQSDEIANLKKKLEELMYMQIEKEACEKRIRELEQVLMEVKDKSVQENGIQVSAFLNNVTNEIDKEELIKMEKQLNLAYHDIEVLNVQLNEAHVQMVSLSTQINLAQERDKLIESLQHKAAQFEKVILEKQKKPDSSTVATNTHPVPDNNDFLKAKYEADVIQKEIEIHLQLKEEFDAKLEAMRSEFMKQGKATENATCSPCIILQSRIKQYEIVLNGSRGELKKMQSQQQEDREAVATLLEIWKEKFFNLETQNHELTNNYHKAKNYCDDLIAQMKQRDNEEARVYESIKKETENAVKLWNQKSIAQIITTTNAHKNKIKEVQKKIDKYSKQADKEIQAIELEYLRNKMLLQERRLI